MSRVRLLDVPVGLFCASEQHTKDLLREIALMVSARTGVRRGHLFADLLAAADRHANRPAPIHRVVSRLVRDAERDGTRTVDVVGEADENAASGALEWNDLLGRFDAMSREDELLTLPAPAPVAAFRTWYATEIAEQARTGRAPLRWAGADALAGAR